MDEQTQEQENFDTTSLVKEAALVEAKKKSGEAKSVLRRLVSAGKNQIKQELNPEQLASKIKSGITNKVKSTLTGKGPRAKSKR